MTLNRSLIFLIAAVVCFVVALLLALAVFSGGNQSAWVDGGLLAFALSFLP
jgi:hypothetical protein